MIKPYSTTILHILFNQIKNTMLSNCYLCLEKSNAKRKRIFNNTKQKTNQKPLLSTYQLDLPIPTIVDELLFGLSG